MMNLLWVGVVLAAGVVVVTVIRVIRRRPHLDSNSSTERLGPVSEQWLTAHRGER